MPLLAGCGGSTPSNPRVAFAQCMRSHGVTRFPNPRPDGGFRIRPLVGSGLIKPGTSAFSAALRSCVHLLQRAQPRVQRFRGRFGGRFAAAGCSTAVARERKLTSVPVRFQSTGGHPFGITVTRDGGWSFVDVPGRGLGVYANSGGSPRLVRWVSLPSGARFGSEALGNTVTPDGRYLLIADAGDGAIVVSVARAESGAADAVLGTLAQPGQQGGPGAIEVTTSPDGRFAFVSIEYGDRVAVYDLAAALAHHFSASGYVGSIPLGQAVVGMAVSPNGRWMYVTSELGSGRGVRAGHGTLTTIKLPTAERDPAHSIVSTVDAHCGPVRVVVSNGGRIVWVTARESDQLLAFSAARLISDPSHALLASIRVGAAPVGLAAINGGRDIIVADSNRFNQPNESAGLTVVNASAALSGRPAITGFIRSGLFPREMAVDPNRHTLLIGNFISGQLETVGVNHLP